MYNDRFSLYETLGERRREVWRKLHRTKWWNTGYDLTGALPYRLSVYRTLLERGIAIEHVQGKAKEYLLELQYLEYEIQREVEKLKERRGA